VSAGDSAGPGDNEFDEDGMSDTINLIDIYDKDLNFLIGSGASVGLFPTLELKLKDAEGRKQTIETLATLLQGDPRRDLLFMHYYATCIKPAQDYRPDAGDSDEKRKVLENYEAFLETVLHILQRRKPLEKRCNVFTTNYDGCLAQAADNILGRGSDDFVLNDGARGFRRRSLQARNFNAYLCQTGIFERSLTSIPQVNLIHLHGSIFWQKDENGILVDYLQDAASDLIPDDAKAALAEFSTAILDITTTVDTLASPEIPQEAIDSFWKGYDELPIVNPTEWKFYETVFEEHYYQMLRLLSYELEKPNAVLITFGFSFADKHILNLVRRSLSNPHLQVFVCCYSKAEFNALSATFKMYSNVRCITLDDQPLNFDAFNQQVFTRLALAKTAEPAPATATAAPEPTAVEESQGA